MQVYKTMQFAFSMKLCLHFILDRQTTLSWIMYSSRYAIKLIVIDILSGIVFVSGQEFQQLSITSSCTCPGYETTYKCTVFSEAATIWLGTAFENCSVDKITLRHSQFTGNDTYLINTTCGAFGTISARAVSVVNDSYTSELTVYVSEGLAGKTIECANGDARNIVGKEEITFTRAIFPPPMNITITEYSEAEEQLTVVVRWNPAHENCPSAHYNVNASSNCGQGPNTMDINSFTYQIERTSFVHEACEIAVQTVVCDNIYGPFSKKHFFFINESSHEIQTDLEPKISKGSTFPDTNIIEHLHKDTSLAVVLSGSLVATVVLSLVMLIVIAILLFLLHKKRKVLHMKSSQADTENAVELSTQSSRDLTNTPREQNFAGTHKLQSPDLIYMDVGPIAVVNCPSITEGNDDCHLVEYAVLRHQPVDVRRESHRNMSDSAVDKLLNLDNVLIQIRGQVTSKWYQFGLALGVDTKILDRYINCSQEESVVELVEYWLSNCSKKPTWKSVAKALEKIGFHDLAKDILAVYKTGKLPIAVDDDDLQPVPSSNPPPLPPKD